MTRFMCIIGFVITFSVLNSLEGAGTSNDITIIPIVRDLLVGDGNRQELKCSVTTNVKASLIWKYPQGSSAKVVEMNVTNADGTNTFTNLLTIASMSKNDTGSYNCTFDTMITTITLYLTEDTAINDEFFFGNKTATLACSITTGSSVTPPSFVDFFKKDSSNQDVSVSQLKNPDRFRVIANNGTLIIDNPIREDTGIYIARYNVSGFTNITLYDCLTVYEGGPLVLDFAKSKKILEGDDLEVECKIIGYPPSKVTWTVGDKVLAADDPRITFENDESRNENATLKIKSLKSSEEGQYTCSATNGENRTHMKSILIRVRDPLDWLWPLIGIACEAVVLVTVILLCQKFNKNKEDSAHTD